MTALTTAAVLVAAAWVAWRWQYTVSTVSLRARTRRRNQQVVLVAALLCAALIALLRGIMEVSR